MRFLAALIFVSAAGALSAQPYTISTFAGGGRIPSNVPATSVSLSGPQSVAVDKEGNLFFVDSSQVFRMDAATRNLTLVAGNGNPGFSGDNGLAIYAQLNNPAGIAVDSAGNLYIADTLNYRIREDLLGLIITAAGNGTAHDLSGDNGPATSVGVVATGGLAVDSAGAVYIAD